MNVRLFTLYINYLRGKYSKGDFTEMRDLISAVSDEELGEMMEKAWQKEIPYPLIAGDARNKLKSRVLRITSFMEERRWIRTKWFSAAMVAMLFLAGGGGLYYWGKHSVANELAFVVEIERGQKAKITLPDNSSVQLNAETKLRYDLKCKTQRRVFLNGEAFFDVAKDETRPFIVDLEDVQIWVVGTTFNARFYRDEESIQT